MKLKEMHVTGPIEAYEGGCTCGDVRYQVTAKPLIVHCCHCRMCQRQTGSAFAINALLEAENVLVLSGEIEELEVPTPSGRGQTIARCATCHTAVWSNYHMNGLRTHIRFVRVGTLDNPDQLPPDIHIFTSSKQPWLPVPRDKPSVVGFYKIDEIWSHASLTRRSALLEHAGVALPQ